MPKKKFNKKEGLRFTLMHRSQQDPLYHDDENGSRYILHPADRKTAEAMEEGLFLEGQTGASYVSSEAAAQSKRTLAEKRKKQVGPIVEYREVDEYGLPIDGYDYSKHFSEMGGGVFIASDGTKLDRPPQLGEKVSAEDDFLKMLPDTVFASKTEHPRLLEAITLKADDMDLDMKRQLGLLESDEDDGGGEEEEEDEAASQATGEWGDLQDDFMAQIISSGIVEKRDDGAEEDESSRSGPRLVKGVMRDDFDFEAHMARLMQEAEAEEDDEDEDGEDVDLDAYQQSGGNRVMRDVDKHFESVMLEYENDDDDFDEEEEEEVEEEEQDEEEGAVDARNDDDDVDFDAAEEGEEEEEEEEEEVFMEGAGMPTTIEELNALMMKGISSSASESGAAPKRKAHDLESRSTMTRKSKRGGVAPLMTQDDPVFLSAVQEFLQEKRADASLGLAAMPPPAKETLQYVKKTEGDASNGRGEEEEEAGEEEEDEEDFEDEEEQPSMEEFMKLWGTYTVTSRPQFDCATIVSTRSTTDNIPSQIVIENNKKKKKKSVTLEMAERRIQEEREDQVSAADTVESLTRDIAQMALQGLTTRNKKETPEERKARKAIVKDLRRERRDEKRQTKDAFKKERTQILNMVMAPGAPKMGVSEFKLS